MVSFVVPKHQLGTAYGLYALLIQIDLICTYSSSKHSSLHLSWLVVLFLFFFISMQSIQNLGLALTALAAGAILDNKGYLVLEVFFCACVCS